MKKLAILFAFVATATIANTDINKTINNVKVSINNNSVKVTLKDKHIFSQDCSDYSCKLFTPLLPDPYIEREDGYIIESAVIKRVSLKNANSFRRFDDTIVFIVNKASVSGLYSHIGHYAIDTNTGSVTVNISEQDVYKHGLPYQKKTVAQVMINETIVKF
jgi:hypothetical protein